jgi:hypothetical protein|tara:strand:+ start:807 stop:1406 length:600 start_codon:yes stop_codon:yes gene_type:complete
MKNFFIIFVFTNFFSYSQIDISVPEYTELRQWSDRLKKIRVPVISDQWMNVLKTDRFTYYTELRQWSDRVKKIQIPAISDDKKSEINVKENIKKGLGFNYQGLGIYSLGKKGKLRNNPKYFKKNITDLEKNSLIELKKFTKRNNYEYEILSIENSIDFYNYSHIEESYPKVLIIFKVFDKDGLPILNKYDDNYISKSGR